MKIIAIIIVSLMLSSCASTPPLSRDEWLRMTNRTYEGVTKEQALAAAEQILRLADGNDFMIAHSDEGFVASRNWSVYLVLAASFGTDVWQLRAAEYGTTGTKVSVSVSTQFGAVGAVATGPSTVAPLTTPSAGSAVNGTAIYEVFWARMDYLLGRSPVWMDCRAANHQVSTGVVWGDNSALCSSFNIKDDAPEGAPLMRVPVSATVESY